MTEPVRLMLVGFGNVGQAFAHLIQEKADELRQRYGLSCVITGIVTGSHGAAIAAQGLPMPEVLEHIARDKNLSDLPGIGFSGDTLACIKACPADVLIETSPMNPTSGQPAIQHIQAGLEQGMHIITANKGPIVHAYTQLGVLAKEKGKLLRFESIVMDGAPIFSLFRAPLAGAKLLGFYGILNSCTNLLLERMEQGETLDEAIVYGASIGITETDPSNDVDGWDASLKVSALATVLMDHPLTPQQVDRTGIRGITPAMIQEAKRFGQRWKLVCRGGWEGGRFIAKVAPERVGPDSPLFTVGGTSSYVLFKTDVLEGLGILESNPSPRTTAFGLLADLIDVHSHA